MKKLIFVVLFFSLFSCRTVYKETTKTVLKTDSIYIDTSRTTILKLQNYILDFQNKEYDYLKTDTIIKIDSFYFRVPIEKIIYREKIIYKDSSITEGSNFQKGTTAKKSNSNNSEATIKEKKTFNYYLLIIPLMLILSLWLLVKKWL